MALLDRTEPSYLLEMAVSKSNSSNLLFDADIILGSVGVNTKLKFDWPPGDVKRVVYGF